MRETTSSHPDVQGWEVFGSDGEKIGTVHGEVGRYLDVELSPSLFLPNPAGLEASEAVATAQAAGIDPLENDPAGERRMTLESAITREPHVGERGDRHVLIPIGAARLDAEERRVLVEGLASGDAPGLPAYEHGTARPEDEAALSEWFAPTGRRR